MREEISKPASLEVNSGESGESSPVGSKVSRRWARTQALVEVILCTDLLATLALQGTFALLGYEIHSILRSPRLLAAFLLGNSALIVATIAAILNLRREEWRTLLGRDFQWQREAVIGLYFVPMLFVATASVGLFFSRFLPELVTSENPMLSMIKTPMDMFWFLLTAVTTGGLKEEIQRAFVLRRFEKYMGGIYLGLVLWTLYFGIGHALQGFDNAVGAGVLGLLFGLIYIGRQSIVAPAVAHAVYDSVVVVYVFLNLS